MDENQRSRFGEPDQPPLDEVAARVEIQREERTVLLDQLANETADERRTVLMALRFWRVVGMMLALTLGIPALGALTGLCVRFFRVTSGLW